MFDVIHKYTTFAITLGSLIIGGAVWLTKLHLDVLNNRKLREEDKQELLKEFNRIAIRVEKVEIENSQTLAVLTDIKVQLSAIETTLRLFLKNK